MNRDNISFLRAVRQNCDISDARDNGIYSICTLVLKLRNLYKWEHDLEPWQEPDSPVLLDWIAAKEAYWESLTTESFSSLPVNGNNIDPFQLQEINDYLTVDGQLYGAGYGRSMKAVFFIAETHEKRLVENCPVLILGKEKARELSSPFAMLQDGVIYIRKEPLRYFFWDQIQEISPACRVSMQQALGAYGLINSECSVDRRRLIDIFDHIIEKELEIFIYHEVGENQENPLTGDVLKKIIAAFPVSALELVARAVKDVLADTHPKGLLGHILAQEKKSSLGFYISFQDGMRKHLCTDLNDAGKDFWENADWSLIEKARLACRSKSAAIAVKFQHLAQRLDRGESPEDVRRWAEENVLAPLGLQVPDRE